MESSLCTWAVFWAKTYMTIQKRWYVQFKRPADTLQHTCWEMRRNSVSALFAGENNHSSASPVKYTCNWHLSFHTGSQSFSYKVKLPTLLRCSTRKTVRTSGISFKRTDSNNKKIGETYWKLFTVMDWREQVTCGPKQCCNMHDNGIGSNTECCSPAYNKISRFHKLSRSVGTQF